MNNITRLLMKKNLVYRKFVDPEIEGGTYRGCSIERYKGEDEYRVYHADGGLIGCEYTLKAARSLIKEYMVGLQEEYISYYRIFSRVR
jgi:hypothetical protein